MNPQTKKTLNIFFVWGFKSKLYTQYYGNTSGYGKELTLPNSKIVIDIPALQFVMNVEEKLPFGSGVIPDHTVIPSIDQYINKVNAPLEFILEKIENEKYNLSK